MERAGYEVRNSGEGTVKETATWGEVVIIAVPFTAVDAVLHELGNSIDGKVMVDVTNALTQDMRLAVGFSTAARKSSKENSGAHVVKAFNTVFAQHMDKGSVRGQQLTLFAASDDQQARRTVLELGRQIGFDPVDAGALAMLVSLRH